METVAFITLLLVTVSAIQHFGKYVFVPNALQWREAQDYCRTHYSDLLPITSHDEEELKNLTAGKVSRFWTGLYWSKQHWNWSGARPDNIPPSVLSWRPDLYQAVSLCLGPGCSNTWVVEHSTAALPFLCLNLVLVEIRKSWEEALEYCKQNYTSLSSMTSKAERILAKRKIQQEHITDRVWIGLRFLRNTWIWMNKDPLSYQAWSKTSEDHLCPVKGRCGALTKEGWWENWDCEEKLNFFCY